MAIEIQLRRDTAIQWDKVNPILAQGEFGYELNTGKAKIGDGVTNWNKLPYFDPSTGGGGGGSMKIGNAVEGGSGNSILFVDADGNLAQDNNNLFYDPLSGEMKLGNANSAGTSGIYSISTLTKLGDFNSYGNGTKIIIDDSALATTIYNNVAINGLTDAMLCADTGTGNISPVVTGLGVHYDTSIRTITAGFTHNKTLFVDRNGDNGTAIEGRPDYPWSDVGTALQYLHDNGLTGYTIWVMPGKYTELMDWVIDDQNTGTTIKFQGGVRINSNFGIRVSNPAMIDQVILSLIGDDEGANIGEADTTNTVLLMRSIRLFDYAVLNMTNIYHRLRDEPNITINTNGNACSIFLNNCNVKNTVNGSNITNGSPIGDMVLSIRNSYFSTATSANMKPNIDFTFPVTSQNNIQIMNSRFYCGGITLDPIKQGHINTDGTNGFPAYWITLSDCIFYNKASGSYVWYDIDPAGGDENRLDVVASVTTNQNSIGSAGIAMNYTTTNTIDQLQPINNISLFGR